MKSREKKMNSNSTSKRLIDDSPIDENVQEKKLKSSGVAPPFPPQLAPSFFSQLAPSFFSQLAPPFPPQLAPQLSKAGGKGGAAPRFGEIKCQEKYSSGANKGKECKNGAYFVVEKSNVCKYLCGMHSKKYEDRAQLDKQTSREKKEKKLMEFSLMQEQANLLAEEKSRKVDASTTKEFNETSTTKEFNETSTTKEFNETSTTKEFNESKEERGARGARPPTIKLVRMAGRFAHVPHLPGYYNVYPNFKKNWQGIGLVMPSLSPMSLGPVKHGQPGIVDALNIENFHQFSKFFSEYETKEEFVKNQANGFADSVPHRRKFPGDNKSATNKSATNKSATNKSATNNKKTGGKGGVAPQYFVWIDKSGQEHLLKGKQGYVESRQFYCNFYDRLVRNLPDFLKLKDLVSKNYSLQICGPDAYDINESIEKSYLNPSRPFGHERVLYTMLTEDESNWPWRKFKTFDF